MHSQHGNGGGKGGKSGKGNSKNQFVPERDPELEYKQQIKDAMPTAARLRVQPRLVQAEWDTPIQHWQHLTASGGVAICPRDALPQTLNNVGYTAHPCAVVLTQSPEDLHLRGYPRSKIRCTFDICTDEGDRQQVIVDRYLVQLGFSQHVHMLPTGDTLSIPTTVKKIVAKCSTHHGWPAGQNLAAILSDFLERFIPREAFSDMICRNGSYTFLCHETFCEAILKISGTNGIFTKMHEVADKDKLELLILDKTTSLKDALVGHSWKN